jgi:subtilisin family serine protease
LVDPYDGLKLARSSDYQDRIGHGTACTSIICHLAPESIVYPIRVFNSNLETSVNIIQAGIRWGVEQNLDLINMSFGTLERDALLPLYATCEAARRSGTVLVAASHNTSTWSYPALFDNVISVAAGKFAEPFDYVYREGGAIECLARGHNIMVQGLEGYRETVSGSSYAAPHIVGLISLFMEHSPGLTLEGVRELLADFDLNRTSRILS